MHRYLIKSRAIDLFEITKSPSHLARRFEVNGVVCLILNYLLRPFHKQHQCLGRKYMYFPPKHDVVYSYVVRNIVVFV